MTEIDSSRSGETFTTAQKSDYVPVLEEVSEITDDELRQDRKKLRQYFLNGKKAADSLQPEVAPVLLAPYLRGETPETDFPLLYDHDSQEVTSLHRVLFEMFFDIFDSGEADILVQNLPRITTILQQKLVEEDPLINYNLQVEEIVNVLRPLSIHFRESGVFEQQCEQIKTKLLAREATLIGFSSSTVFELINLQLKKRKEHNQAFLKTLMQCIAGLKEILLLHGDEIDSTKDHFDFAGQLISFDRIEEIAKPAVSSSLPEERLNRLRHSLQTLSTAQKSYSDNSSTIIVSRALTEEFALKKILSEATLEITSEKSCTKAKSYFSKEIREFVQIIAAIRLSELEINQQYDENLHTPYFEGFDTSYLSEDDISYFRSLIVVEESRELMVRPKDFLALLSEGAFVKVLAINRLDEFNVTASSKEEDETYLELAALAIFRRNACVFQGAADTPLWLNEALNNGLDAPCPALWNVLFTGPGPKGENTELSVLKTAIESRYFPHLAYDIRSGDDFGSHFDISRNPHSDQPFSSLDREIKSPSGKQTCQYSLTMADFLAMSTENRKMLEVLPSGYRNEDLIPLAEYLILPQDTVAGKVPFIWMVDEHDILKQAVVPVSWLQRCKARLDYWHFFQELGGASNTRLSQAIKEVKSEWENDKKTEIENLKNQLRTEFDRTRKEDLENAVKRILNALLGTENEIATLLKPSDVATNGSQEVIQPVSEPKLAEEKEDLKTTISSDAWVESDQCTSCNDCTDALPSVFKYDSDKLAFVHNPKGGTYAKIVATAEKCPARCIHPGLPQNSSEAGLEKLIKRAEKYN